MEMRDEKYVEKIEPIVMLPSVACLCFRHIFEFFCVS